MKVIPTWVSWAIIAALCAATGYLYLENKYTSYVPTGLPLRTDKINTSAGIFVRHFWEDMYCVVFKDKETKASVLFCETLEDN